jgi:cytochrome c oxidase subunit 1
MRRRIADYDPALNLEFGQLLITIAGIVIGLSVLICLYNLLRAARRGQVAEANPWGSRSPEWQIPSPIPEVSYSQPFVVTGDPYDYGLPGSVYVKMSPSGASS